MVDTSEYWIMHESKDWEANLRLGAVEEAMYAEERDNRKRKWEGKRDEEKEQRKVPPKKIMAALGDMGGGSSSSSSHMSPGWQVNDLDLDLPGELSMNDALLSLPSLAVFKQEAPSPTSAVVSPPRRAWPRRDERQVSNMVVDNARDGLETNQSPPHAMMAQHSACPESMQCQPMSGAMVPISGYHSPVAQENKISWIDAQDAYDDAPSPAAGLLMCSPASSLDGFLYGPTRADPSFKDDTRFQYVLAAATSIATKQNEETLTYLNQGQPYEIKLKKLGDLSHFKGKMLKSVIKICFHERRLQYMEREQIAQWHSDRPGERILEVDVPLSYGVVRVEQPSATNALHVYWDPTKDVGVYVKVNCISTEFTAKKHGGEKGVPFRVQIETALAGADRRLHAAACQIKVFKLKGADRKHKQDREKVLRRPRADLDKYQPGCEATVLSTLSNDALLPPPSLVTTSPPYSPEMCTPPKAIASPGLTNKAALGSPAILASSSQMKPLYCQDGSDMKASSPPCHSPGAILPDLPQSADDADKNNGLPKEATAEDTQAWLSRQRFSHHLPTFANFAGADLLRLSRDDLIQICGLADGIRLYNALHAKRIEPRLTVYVSAGGAGGAFAAVFLQRARAAELRGKLAELLDPHGPKECETVLISTPHGARVLLTDEVVRHLPDHAAYRLQRLPDPGALLLLPATPQLE